MTAATALAVLYLSLLASGAATQPGGCRLNVADPLSLKSLTALKSDPVLSAYPKCVEARARALEPSGASLDEIASKALHACKAERAVYAEAMAACGGAKFVRGELTVQDQILRWGIRAIIGELRAQRRSLPNQDTPPSNLGHSPAN
ncbi:MAG TPA: hypothetical protein VGI30_04230 [Caulobacteraceae bacterium]|jgi:hypothetical protein